MDITQFWAELTEAQASLIGSGATVFSALIVAILGPMIFRGAVQGIEDARDKAKEAADSIRANFDVLTDQLSSLTITLATVQNRVEDVVVAEESGRTTDQANAPGELRRERIKQIWTSLQREAEALAGAPWIDGRVQGKYSRIDRRNYVDLLKSMQADGNLAGTMPEWERALNLWYTYRARNTEAPEQSVIDEMLNIAARLEASIEAFRRSKEIDLLARKQAKAIQKTGRSGNREAKASPE